jgi:hypothetical protein
MNTKSQRNFSPIGRFEEIDVCEITSDNNEVFEPATKVENEEKKFSFNL